MLPWVVLGVGASKRTRGLITAAAAGGAPVRLVEWREWLASADALERHLQQPCRFKIEPPGDDAQAHLRLLHLGCERLGRPPCPAPERGELLAADAWFEGFSLVMQRLAALLRQLQHVKAVNAPDEIVAMTDKLICQRRLLALAVPTAPLLGPVHDFDHFTALLDRHGLDRVFLKARYGSSAAGVVAYRRNRRGQQQATTSAQLHEGDEQHAGGRLFNVKRLRSYQRPDEVRRVVDLVAAQGAYAEAWIPKPRCGAGHFDLRMVTFGGRAAHRVARIGQRPMTNLHLDSERADPAQLLAAPDLQAAEAAAERGARVFPGSQIIGFDLVVRRGQAHVLEANAFGDLLPGLLWHGRDTYATALHEGGLR
jgi:glutathione synthase/RimK-type ligase-like ATP-grasp enzyme